MAIVAASVVAPALTILFPGESGHSPGVQAHATSSYALSESQASGAARHSAGPAEDPAFEFGVVANISLPPESVPVGVGADSADGSVYVSTAFSDKVSVINGSTEKLVATIPVGSNPAGVVYDNANSEIYVADLFGDNVTVISTATNTVVTNIGVPAGPAALAYDSGNGNVWVADQFANSTSEISGTLNTVIETIPVGIFPISVAYDPSTGNVFVANAGSGNVSVISTSTDTVIHSVPVGKTPLALAYDSGDGDVYVANEISNNTTVFSATNYSAVASVPTGSYPSSVAFNPAHSVVGVVAQGKDRVDFISDATNTLIGNVTVGDEPVGLAYNAFNGYEYVANSNSSNVSVIGTSVVGPYPVTFDEVGLAAGTNWSVTLGGVTKNSTTASIGYSENNGSYAYTVGAVAGYSLQNPSGTVLVQGFLVNVQVTYGAIKYDVSFQESGLPTGTSWSVTFKGTLSSSTSPTLVFNASNGTYPYSITPVAGYSEGPSSGDVSVHGGPAFVAVTFTTTGVATYTVTFTESGLASGTSWVVTLGGAPQSSTAATLNFTEPNGSYPFTVGAVSGYNVSPVSGTANVSGASVGVKVTFTPISPSTTPTSSTSTPLWVYLLVALVIAAVVIGTVVFLRRRKPPASSTPSPPSSGNPPKSP